MNAPACRGSPHRREKKNRSTSRSARSNGLRFPVIGFSFRRYTAPLQAWLLSHLARGRPKRAGKIGPEVTRVSETYRVVRVTKSCTANYASHPNSDPTRYLFPAVDAASLVARWDMQSLRPYPRHHVSCSVRGSLVRLRRNFRTDSHLAAG